MTEKQTTYDTSLPYPDDLSDIKARLNLSPDASADEVYEALDYEAEQNKNYALQKRRENRKQSPGEYILGISSFAINAMTKTGKWEAPVAVQALKEGLIDELEEEETIKGLQNQGKVAHIELIPCYRTQNMGIDEQMRLNDNTRMVRITFDNGNTEELSLQQIEENYRIVTPLQ